MSASCSSDDKQMSEARRWSFLRRCCCPPCSRVCRPGYMGFQYAYLFEIKCLFFFCHFSFVLFPFVCLCEWYPLSIVFFFEIAVCSFINVAKHVAVAMVCVFFFFLLMLSFWLFFCLLPLLLISTAVRDRGAALFLCAHESGTTILFFCRLLFCFLLLYVVTFNAKKHDADIQYL